MSAPEFDLADYRPTDALSLWWLARPEQPVLVGTLLTVRASRGVSLRYAPLWLQSDFALSEDLPLRDVAAVVNRWQEHFAACGVTPADIAALAGQIDQPFLREQREAAMKDVQGSGATSNSPVRLLRMLGHCQWRLGAWNPLGGCSSSSVAKSRRLCEISCRR